MVPLIGRLGVLGDAHELVLGAVVDEQDVAGRAGLLHVVHRDEHFLADVGLEGLRHGLDDALVHRGLLVLGIGRDAAVEDGDLVVAQDLEGPVHAGGLADVQRGVALRDEHHVRVVVDAELGADHLGERAQVRRQHVGNLVFLALDAPAVLAVVGVDGAGNVPVGVVLGGLEVDEDDAGLAHVGDGPLDVHQRLGGPGGAGQHQQADCEACHEANEYGFHADLLVRLRGGMRARIARAPGAKLRLVKSRAGVSLWSDEGFPPAAGRHIGAALPAARRGTKWRGCRTPGAPGFGGILESAFVRPKGPREPRVGDRSREGDEALRPREGGRRRELPRASPGSSWCCWARRAAGSRRC